jgi:Myb-like DNA-binding domain
MKAKKKKKKKRKVKEEEVISEQKIRKNKKNNKKQKITILQEKEEETRNKLEEHQSVKQNQKKRNREMVSYENGKREARKRIAWSTEEVIILLQQVQVHGYGWNKIARALPQRTDMDCRDKIRGLLKNKTLDELYQSYNIFSTTTTPAITTS